MTTFLNPTTQVLNGKFSGGALGDYNNDGYLDVVYAIQKSSGIAIFLGKAGGGFNSSTLFFSTATPDIRSHASSDLNNDGFLDLIGSDLTSGNVYFYRGLGNGSFATPTSLGVVSNAYIMVLTDLDKNGTKDIAVTTQSRSSVSILYTDILGSVVSTKSVSSGGAWDRGIDAADFNNDGYQDLVVTNVNNNVASVLYGPNLTNQTLLTTDTYPIGVVAADLNNDGKIDFVTTNHNVSSNSISIFLNTGASFKRTDISLGGYPDDYISAQDFNGDGHKDLSVNIVGSGLKILLGNGTGESFTSEFYSAVNLAAKPFVFDQNKDGDLDIITSMDNGIYIFENNTSISTYNLVSNTASINEGLSATFTLTTTNVSAGTNIAYKISGVSSSDITGGNLSGTAVVNANGVAAISVSLLNDLLTEGVETLTISLQDKSASTVINDTSKSAETSAIYSDYTKHYYQAFANNVSWYSALSLASAQSYRGLQGYLVTITNQYEDDFVSNNVVKPSGITGYSFSSGYKSFWVGASDEYSEGKWIWMAGPERDQIVYQYGGNSNTKYENFYLPVYSLGSTDADYLFSNVPVENATTLFPGNINRIFWDDISNYPTLSGQSGNGFVVEYGGLPATYSITPNSTSVDEGSTLIFTVNTTNIEWGTSINYSISGITSADISDGKLSGTTTIFQNGLNGIATVVVNIVADRLTEGNEALILSVGSATASALINDTSPAIVTNETHSIAVIVDKGVISSSAILLKGLTEKVTLTNGIISAHTVEYAGTTYNYNSIDLLITTVTRDGEFTDEYKKELMDAAPTASNLTYRDAVTLVGVLNIDAALISVAGLDGNFVG